MKRNTAQPTAQPTHTHNTTKEGTMNTAHSPQPTVKIPAGTPRVPWSVKGRGKSATYCAGLTAGTGQTGQRVALVAQSGAVTFATLTEVRETSDGVSRWDFDRDTDRMTAEVRAANRAAKATHTAEYWQSPAGLTTAQRIAQRTAAKATAQPTAPQPTAPAKATAPPAASVDTAPPAADLASVAAALRSAGFTAAEVVAALAQHSAQPTAPAAVTAPVSQPTAPTAPAVTMAQSPDLEKCDACNRERRGCGSHAGAPDLLVCPRCATLDADTARVRAQRHAGK